jgi:alpha-glucosidase
MQYGVLTPFCRNHSEIGNVDQYAWAWGQVIQDLVRTAIRLRYRLLPYLYATFLRASETGAPVQRPLVFDYQYDPTVRDIDDEYLLGPDLLVAPVFTSGATARQVYLPAGGWYDWHTGARISGNRYVIATTPMDRIPIYARAGAVIPMWPEAPASTAGYHPSIIELHLFVPETDGTHYALLQEDDGLTLAALDGVRYRTNFELTRGGDRVSLRAVADGDGYSEFARKAFHLVIHGAAPPIVRLDGIELPASDGRFVLPNAGTSFTLDFAIDS